MAKGKVKIYLKSGNTIMIECTECSFTVDKITGDYTGYDFKDTNNKSFGINVAQIEAWEYIK